MTLAGLGLCACAHACTPAGYSPGPVAKTPWPGNVPFLLLHTLPAFLGWCFGFDPSVLLPSAVHGVGSLVLFAIGPSNVGLWGVGEVVKK